MGTDSERVQREAATTAVGDAAKPDSSGRQIREVALARYLGVQLRGVTGSQREAKRDEHPAGEGEAGTEPHGTAKPQRQ